MTPNRFAELHAAAFAPSRGWTGREFKALLDSAHVTALVRPNGFALVRTVADETELLTLAVHPAARRRGTADALLGEWLGATSAKKAFLEVACDNHAAIALYIKRGFVGVSKRKAYYSRPDGPAVDALLMQVALTPR